jgi:asparagine synthase (glutamine-hydrolysing)
MCGIIGMFNTYDHPIDDINFTKGVEKLYHRGPNDFGIEKIQNTGGVLRLGHTRLSIIDLSKAGHQPMYSQNNKFTIIFNGEIYNYKEIKIELTNLGYTFINDTDTEVLLTAWEHWGSSCLIKLIGMFSFCIFDKLQNNITLIRDAFGIKPLFFKFNDTSFYFASEINALLQISNCKTEFNNKKIYDYLIYGTEDFEFNTFILGVNHLPPSHLVSINLNNIYEYKIEKWWNPEIEQRSNLSFTDAASKLRDLFLESIKFHLRSDVPFGVALSGGIDSSAIACSIKYIYPDLKIHTFSYISDDDKITEEYWVDLVNDFIDAIPHKIHVNEKDLESDIYNLIKCQGEPFCTTSMYAQYRVFQATKISQITVLLEGQGADELLAGYQGFQGQRMLSLLESFDFLNLYKFAKNWPKWPGRKNITPWTSLFGQLISSKMFFKLQLLVGINARPNWINKSAINTSGSIIKQNTNNNPFARKRRVMNELLQSLTKHGLPSLLRYGDRNAMFFSIENRVPFLTIPMAEFILSLPEEYLISNNGETKCIFRESMRGIVPDAILNRRDKIGFVTPSYKWVIPLIDKILNDNLYSLNSVIYNSSEVRNHLIYLKNNINNFKSNDWRLINLLFWENNIQSI